MFYISSGNLAGLYFAFCVVIDGTEYKTGIGKNKKAARLQAAKYALQDLLPTLENLECVVPKAPGSSRTLMNIWPVSVEDLSDSSAEIVCILSVIKIYYCIDFYHAAVIMKY